MLLRDRVTTVPVPVTGTICGLAPPLSEKVRVALRDPIAVGRNFTFTVQAAFPAKLPAQVCDGMRKSPALAPVTVIPLKVKVKVLWLVRVTVWAALVVPRSWGEKFRAEGDHVTAVPVPLRLIVCGLPLALSLIVTVPVRTPTAAGLNATLIVQLICGARELPQVFEGIVKSPESVMLLIANATVPVFFNTTFLEALVVPSTCTPKVRVVVERLTIGNP